MVDAECSRMGGGQLLYTGECGVDDGCGGEIPEDTYSVILGPLPCCAACDGDVMTTQIPESRSHDQPRK